MSDCLLIEEPKTQCASMVPFKSKAVPLYLGFLMPSHGATGKRRSNAENQIMQSNSL